MKFNRYPFDTLGNLYALEKAGALPHSVNYLVSTVLQKGGFLAGGFVRTLLAARSTQVEDGELKFGISPRFGRVKRYLHIPPVRPFENPFVHKSGDIDVFFPTTKIRNEILQAHLWSIFEAHGSPGGNAVNVIRD